MTKKLFTLLLAVTASIGTMFASTKIGDLYYNLDATNQTAEVTSQNSSYPYWSTTITTANIPAIVTYNSVAYSVTSIGNSAFYRCTSLTSVTIPNSVTSIGNNAFDRCSGLTSVTIGNSVTSIGGYAFVACTSLTSVTIPNSVTSIGNNAFDRCSGLTSVTIGNSVTSIGNYAFDGCSGLTSVTISNSVTSIGSSAFSGCTGLTSVTIPNSVTSIENYAFQSCSNLASIEFPNGITTIEDGICQKCNNLSLVTFPNSITIIKNRAFENCTSLTSIEIPNDVTSIGEQAFNGCTSLSTVTCLATTPPELSPAVFEKSNISFSILYVPCASITAYASADGWKEFSNIQAINPDDCGPCLLASGTCGAQGDNLTWELSCDGVLTISGTGEMANYSNVPSVPWYSYHSSIQYVVIGNNVSSIGWWAFRDCTSLTSVEIPNSVTSIGDGAFLDCSGLTSIEIPNSVTSIGNYAFYGCSGLTAIYVPCGEMERFKQMLNNDSRINDHAPLPYTITINAEHGNVTYPQTMCDDMQLTATPNYGYHFVKWSDGVTNNPRAIVLTQDTTFTAEFAPDRVGTCGKDLALVWSYDPTNKVLTIGNAGSFTENIQFGVEAPTEMEELVIGNSVTAIGANAFAGIETLKKITIGESVKTIGEQAFYNCVNLETIFNYRPTPTNTYSNTFDGVDKFECVLYVLPSSIDMYKNAAVWRDFYYTYAIGAEETTVTTNDVTVEPQDNAATLTWPTSNNAASYTIEITKDGVLFCTLIFNANGQLIGIAFAPGRDGEANAPAALMTANGLQFTVTGLSSGTQYSYSVTAKDSNDQPVATYSGEFTTTSEGIATGIEDVQSDDVQCTKVVRDGQIFILRGDKIYNAQGALVK